MMRSVTEGSLLKPNMLFAAAVLFAALLAVPVLAQDEEESAAETAGARQKCSENT